MARRDGEKPKIGAGHAGAMLRKGFEELRALPYSDSNIAQPSGYGLFGTLTPGEIADARYAVDRDWDEEPQHDSVLADVLKQVEHSRDERDRDVREPDMER